MTDRWPRGMSVELAAEYCGVGTALLRDQGPTPVRIGHKRLVWLREDLDAWLDRLAGKAAPSAETNPWLIPRGKNTNAVRSGL